MYDLSHSDGLAEARHMTLILRLVLDQSGQLSHGEFIDVGTKAINRFKDWDELVRTLRAWLASQAADDPTNRMS